MNFYSFTRLINKYSVDVEVEPNTSLPAEYDEDGEPIKTGSGPIIMRMAVIPFDFRTINQSGGLITQSDRQIYSLTPLTNGTHIKHQGMTFKIDTSIDFTPYGDFYRYMGRGVNIFDRP